MKKQKLHLCPCCGANTITEIGNYEICPQCGWEDDPVQSKDTEFAGGANTLSLTQARATYAKKKQKKP